MTTDGASAPIVLHQARRSPLAWLAAAGALLVAALGVAEFVSPEWLASVLPLSGELARWQWLAIPAGILAMGVLAQALGYPEVTATLEPAHGEITVETRWLWRRSIERVPLAAVADVAAVRTGRRPEYRLALLLTDGQRLVLDHQTVVETSTLDQRAQAIKARLQAPGTGLA